MVQSQSGLRNKLSSGEQSVAEGEIKELPVTARVYQGKKPALRNWKIASPDGIFTAEPVAEETVEGFDLDRDESFPAQSSTRDLNVRTPKWLQATQYISVFLTVAWLTYSIAYLAALPNAFSDIFASPVKAGGLMATILAPVSFLWLCVTTWQRRSDAHLYAEALRSELQRLLFPTEDQSRAVNRDIQLLVQQAVEISTSSRAALKSIQRARQGLRSEIRDFSGVSQKTEFHIDRLADTLAKRSEELLKITGQIEQRSKNIHEEVKTGVEVWSEISSEALGKVNELQAGFDKTTENLESKTLKLNEATLKLSVQAEKIDSDFEAGFSKLENIGNKSIESFQKITDELERFDGISQNICTRTEAVQKNLSQQTDLMKDAAKDLERRVDTLDDIGTTATHKLSEALSSALCGSDAIVSAVRRAREQLESAAHETTDKAQDILDRSGERVDNIAVKAAERLVKIEEVLASYDNRHKDIADILEQLTAQNETVSVVTDTALDRLTNVVHLLDQSSQTIDAKTAKPLIEIRQATEQLTEEVGRIHKTLVDGASEIDLNTEKTRLAADEIAKSLNESNKNLETLTSQVTNRTQELHGQLEEQSGKLSDFVQSTSSLIEDFESRIESQLGIFIQAVEAVEGNIQALGSDFEDKGQQAVSQAKSYVDELKDLKVDVSDLLNGFSTQTVEATDLLRNHESELRKSVEATAPLYGQMTEGFKHVEDRFDHMRDNAETSSQEILQRMKALSVELETQIEKLNTEVEQSERSISSLSENLEETATNVGNSVSMATVKLKSLEDGMQEHTDNLQNLAEKSLSRIEEVSGELGRASDMLDQRVETSSRKIELTSNTFVEEGHRLALAGEQTLHKASRVVTSIHDESMRLAEKSTLAIAQMQKAGDSLSIRAREIEEYSKSAISNTQDYNDSLKEQVGIISENSSGVVDALGEALTRLRLQAEEHARQSDKIVDRVGQARESLVHESNRLEKVTVKATEISEEAAAKFLRHSNMIMKSAEDISGHADRVKELHLRSSREAFLSSAKFIIESLHSLAVDVSRHLENDVDERSWKAYQKGDVSVFTRHLVEVAGQIPMERVRRKFTEDSEFRNYTQRYIRQFEELFEAAQGNDHGELLSSVFVSSDVGKLYRLLCEISGRASKGN